jgi:cell division protease FtsH
MASAGHMAYSDFLDEVRNNRIKQATIQEGQGGTDIVAVMNDDRRVRTRPPTWTAGWWAT